MRLVDGNGLADDEFAALGAHDILIGAFKKLNPARLTSLTACRGVVSGLAQTY
jgi:hypothetical protein